MQNPDCGILLKQIDTLLAKRANAAMKQAGVTLSQVTLLRVLAEQPQQRAEFKFVERELGVSQPTTAGLIARLREKGLVTCCASPTTANAKVAQLTPAGQAVVEACEHDMRHEEEVIFAGFAPDEREQLLAMLARVRANLGG